ncbi:hypothetical protein DFH28DRAFT_1150605 [Melampsora americana]|nr:hypothetical protein DFH28DRAFT_1150605 [Melampsora americana]
MDCAAPYVSPTITGGIPALDLTCTPENGRTSQSHESRDSLTLVTPGSSTGLVLDSPILHDPKLQELPSHPIPDTSSKNEPLTSTHSRLHMSTTPEVLPELVKDPVGQDSSPQDIQISSTPSTSSSHGSSHRSPIAPHNTILDSVNDLSPDLSSVRRHGRGRKPKLQKSPPPDIQIIHHLPEVTAEAIKTFDLLEQNWYQFKGLGKTKMLDDFDGNDPSLACGLDSGCINYLTQVECLKKECRCLQMCQNQRFQKRQYAPIEIVATERKGFRANLISHLVSDSFIYEYIGEVVGEKAFQRRIKEYAQEGLKHFYFMQLQREEYIDATKKGGLGRFLNHSCNPNCYIGKWVRAVKSGEELTFNYNVDRYGYEAQECFCGEAKCVGFLGGKTQTDVGAMDELYIDGQFGCLWALPADVEDFGLKGSKTKKGKKMDVDYNPIMKCIPLKDVPKVASAIRQSISNQRILSKLLRRILITEDPAVQKQLMRLHGFSMMSMVLNEYLDNQEIVKTTLEILLRWPLITKNKIVSTNIEATVMKLSSSPSEMIQTLAAELMAMWVDLSVSYRIPKAKGTEDVEGSKRKSDNILDQIFSKRIRRQDSGHNAPRLQLVSETKFIRPEAAKRINIQDLKPENIPLPLNWAFEKTPDDKVYYYHIFTRQTQWTIPTVVDVAREEKEVADFYARQKAAAVDVDDIVAKTKAEAEAVRLEAEAHHHGREQHASFTNQLSERSRTKSSSASTSNAKQSSSQTKDKKMLRLFSTVVVRTMSRYKDSFEHDQFKKRAKELTNILCQKEAKSSNYLVDNYDKLTPNKEAKIISFVKDWSAKLLARKGLTASTYSSSRNSNEISGQKSAPSSLAIFRISEPVPMSAPLSHVRDTPFTPDSKSSSDLSNGDLDSNLLQEINGQSKPHAPDSVEDLDTQPSDLADESLSNTTALTIPDQLQNKTGIQTMPFDKAPPPPPPCSTLQSVLPESITTLMPTTLKLANGEADVDCSAHSSQVKPSLSMPTPVSPIHPSPIQDSITHQKNNVLSRPETSSTTSLFNDGKNRTSPSPHSPPYSP